MSACPADDLQRVMRAAGPAVCEIASRRERRRHQQDQPPHHSRAQREGQHEPTLQRGLKPAARETQIHVAHDRRCRRPTRPSRSCTRAALPTRSATSHAVAETQPLQPPAQADSAGRRHQVYAPTATYAENEQTPPDHVRRAVDQYRAVRDRPSRHDGRQVPATATADQHDRAQLAAPTHLRCGNGCRRHVNPTPWPASPVHEAPPSRRTDDRHGPVGDAGVD